MIASQEAFSFKSVGIFRGLWAMVGLVGDKQPKIKAFFRQEEGGATIEFVLWLPIIFLILLLIVDSSMLFMSRSQAIRVLQDTNRLYSVGQFTGTAAERIAAAQNYALARLRGLSPSATAVTTRATTGSDRLQIKYPTVTTTPESISDAGSNDSDGSSGQIDARGNAPEVSEGEQSYSFYAITEVDLLVVVDNVIVWQQPLGAGQATGYLTGTSFVVSISGADSIIVLDGNGEETVKSGSEFTLP